MKRFFFFLLVLALAVSSLALADTPEITLETPAPARIHEAPRPTAELPAIIDLTRHPELADSVRFTLDAKILHVWFPNIVNSDEAILMYDGDVWLIDCADEKNSRNGVTLMQKLGITQIDMLFNSHPHHDHILGLENTDAAVRVQKLLICYPEDSTDSMVTAIDYCREKKIPVEQFRNGDIFTMGDGKVSLRFFWPDDPTLDMNNTSAQTMLQYGSRRMLFMADMERPGQEALLHSFSVDSLRAEIIKYPHHGKNGLLEEFFQEVQPSLAVVTNTYVEWNGINYLIWKKVPYLYTDPWEKYLHIYTDGNTWVVEYVPMNFNN